MNLRRTLCSLLIALTPTLAAAQDAERPDENDMFGGSSSGPSQVEKDAGKDRPSESDLFGGPPGVPNETAAPTPGIPLPAAPGDRDSAELANPHPERDAFATGEAIDNPLTVGGLYYQQSIVSARKNTAFSLTGLDMPMQFDGFLDVRPNNRLRGFIDMRLVYDAARDAYSNATAGSSLGSLQTSSTAAAPSGINFTTVQVPNNPSALLNEAWIKFDIERKVFVSAGKQHLKWGASRFWNPTDFLNPTKRDPLMPYDLRLGVTMVKLQVPFEASQSNLYGVVLYDNPIASSTIGQLGAAVRGETLLGPTELGVEMVWRDHYSPVLGFDWTAPVSFLDVYVEGAVYLGQTPAVLQLNGDPEQGGELTNLYSSHTRPAGSVQISGGAHFDFAWMDNRQATFGAEYFYNRLGYTDPRVYPILIFLGKYLPFYTGVNYGALYFTAEGPDEHKHTNYTASLIGNLSDESFIGRIDFTWRLLTYLTFGAYADAHFGTQGGEFNFSLNTAKVTTPLSFNGNTIPKFNLPVTLFDIGASLRMSF